MCRKSGAQCWSFGSRRELTSGGRCGASFAPFDSMLGSLSPPRLRICSAGRWWQARRRGSSRAHARQGCTSTTRRRRSSALSSGPVWWHRHRRGCEKAKSRQPPSFRHTDHGVPLVCARRSLIAFRCVGCRIVSTGHGADRTTFSATLPISMWLKGPRPCVPMTMSSNSPSNA